MKVLTSLLAPIPPRTILRIPGLPGLLNNRVRNLMCFESLASVLSLGVEIRTMLVLRSPVKRRPICVVQSVSWAGITFLMISMLPLTVVRRQSATTLLSSLLSRLLLSTCLIRVRLSGRGGPKLRACVISLAECLGLALFGRGRVTGPKKLIPSLVCLRACISLRSTEARFILKLAGVTKKART